MITQVQLSGDEMVAHTRIKTTGTRIALGALAAVTAFLLHQGLWPMAWFCLYGLTQIADGVLFHRFVNRPDTVHPWLLVAAIVLSVTVFAMLSVYNWFLGGDEGRIFAAISICCSLVSVTVTMYPSRRLLLAAMVPHAVSLLGLPLLSLGIEPMKDTWAMTIVVIAIVIYLVYLGLAVHKLNSAMTSLRETSAEAERSRQAAEQANAAKSSFLAVITHEIRTPMNAVVSAVALMKRTVLSDEQKSHLGLLSEASDVLLGLLNNVLDLSKIEAGKMTFEAVPVNVADMMANLNALFGPQLKHKNLKLKMHIDSEVATEVMGDPLRMRQILFNLVSNAVKFTDRGTVRIEVCRLVEAGTPRLAIQVEDQGIGIAETDCERIFSSFEQGEAATTRRYGGSGLGLAISRRLARLMGGDLNVRSTLGSGSCFTLSLPYVPAEAQSLGQALDVPDVTASARAAPVRVLIVDDHDVNRRIVSLFLEPLGWSWTMAENGAEALELCHNQIFDVILMDMMMPVMDGITATRAIRAERGPNQATPVIALTANAMDHHRRAWQEVGVQTFLAKPIEPEALISALAYRAAGNIEGLGSDDAVVAV